MPPLYGNVGHLKQLCSGLAAFFGGTLRLNTHSLVPIPSLSLERCCIQN